MLLQRLGRLWRHSQTQRPASAKREAWLLRPTLENAIANPPQAFGKTALVYSPYVLSRSLQVWQGRLHVLIPGDIRAIIESTYEDRQETGAMLDYQQVLKKQREALKGMALVGLSASVKTLPEEKASTRHSSQDSLDVLLIKSYRLDRQRGGAEVVFLDGKPIFLPHQGHGLTPVQKRELAAKLIYNTVKVADYIAPSPAKISLEWLRGYIYLGKLKQGESALRVAKVLDDDTIVSLDGGDVSNEYCISYNDYLGYQADK
jgi:CRISPR-associated endonuclease/helicase Cas3